MIIGKIYIYGIYNIMLPKVSATNYERCYPKRLKRIFQSNLNMRSYNKFVPNMERAVVGNIPPELIHLFPKETRGENIKSFQTLLSDTAVYLRETARRMGHNYDYSLFDKNYQLTDYAHELAQGAKDRFDLKLAQIPGCEDLVSDFKFAGEGDYGNIFKLSIKRKTDGQKIMHDKAFKVYHELYETNPFYSHLHNACAEANFWEFVKYFAGHKLDNTQLTRHYISDLHSGYCMTEFIDEKIHKTTSPLNVIKDFYFKVPRDSELNRPIWGKLFDGGGYEKNKSFIFDKTIIKICKNLNRSNAKTLPDLLARYNALAQNPKAQHRDKIQRAIDLFNRS